MLEDLSYSHMVFLTGSACPPKQLSVRLHWVSALVNTQRAKWASVITRSNQGMSQRMKSDSEWTKRYVTELSD